MAKGEPLTMENEIYTAEWLEQFENLVESMRSRELAASEQLNRVAVFAFGVDIVDDSIVHLMNALKAEIRDANDQLRYLERQLRRAREVADSVNAIYQKCNRGWAISRERQPWEEMAERMYHKAIDSMCANAKSTYREVTEPIFPAGCERGFASGQLEDAAERDRIERVQQVEAAVEFLDSALNLNVRNPSMSELLKREASRYNEAFWNGANDHRELVFFTRDKVARYFGVSQRTVAQWLQDPTFPGHDSQPGTDGLGCFPVHKIHMWLKRCVIGKDVKPPMPTTRPAEVG